MVSTRRGGLGPDSDDRTGAQARGAGGRSRVRLTDQALVAVRLGRHAAPAGASVADLLVGLAAEPEGVAGRRLADHPASIRLSGRSASAPARMPALDVAVGWAAGAVRQRPLWTSDLLAAAVEVGGSDLADLLAACGFEPADLAVDPPEALAPWEAVDRGEALAETWGYDPGEQGWTRPAARAVARTRALGGGAVTLLIALAAEEAVAPDAVPLDADELRRRLHASRSPAALVLEAADERDRGLDVVVDAARRTRVAGAPVAPIDLLRGALLVGGQRPAALLAPSGGGP